MEQIEPDRDDNTETGNDSVWMAALRTCPEPRRILPQNEDTKKQRERRPGHFSEQKYFKLFYRIWTRICAAGVEGV